MVMLTNLASTARAAGLRVVECAGWRDRGHGQMGAIRTITCHHTANGGAAGNYPSLRVVRDGRPGLSGPLAQLGLGIDGTVYVIAAGLSWHAGVSRHVDYTNSHAIGIEAEARGTGWSGDWPAAQMRAYARLTRALVDHYGLDVADIRGHKETCSPAGRKIDPSLSMTVLRSAAKAVDLKEDDDMALPKTRAEALGWFDLFWRGKIPGEDEHLGGADLTPAQHLDFARRRAEEARDLAVTLGGKVDELETKVDALLARPGN